MVSILNPLTGMEDLVLLVIRIILGGIMIYYGSFKIKDLKANAKSFDKMGFKPGAFWGFIVMTVEFFGGILIILGFYVGIIAALFGFQMILGTIWKITKANKPFTDWSYDLILLAIALILVTFGSGMYSLDNLLVNLLS